MGVVSESLQRAINGKGAAPLCEDGEACFVDYIDKALGFAFLRGKPDLLDNDEDSVDRAERRLKSWTGPTEPWYFGGHVWKWGNFGVERVS